MRHRRHSEGWNVPQPSGFNSLRRPEAALQRPSHLASLLLWDEQGLKYFKKVIYNQHYYLMIAEIDILHAHSAAIASLIEPGSIVLELGSGALRKTNILLQALEAQGEDIDYYALDLDRNELVRTLRQLMPGNFKHVQCHGLLGTYEEGREWLS